MSTNYNGRFAIGNALPFQKTDTSIKDIVLVNSGGGTVLKVTDSIGKIKYASSHGLVPDLDKATVIVGGEGGGGIDPSIVYNNPTFIGSLSKDKVGLGNVANLPPKDLPASDEVLFLLSQKISSVKTINGQSLVGNGDIVISTGTTSAADLSSGVLSDLRLSNNVLLANAVQTVVNKNLSGISNNFSNIPVNAITDLPTILAGKQAALVSGTTIKSINGQSILGAGNIVITGGAATSDASTLTTGTLPDSRLSNNVATYSGAGVFSGKTFSGVNNTFSSIPLAAITNLESILEGKQPTLGYTPVNLTGSYADPGFITSLSKSKVGLSNVDNTSDLLKPISTAVQTAFGSSIIPAANNSASLGSSTFRYANIWSSSFLSGGSVTYGTGTTNNDITFRQGTSGTNVMSLKSITGNLHLFPQGPTPADTGYRLHVNGTAKVTGRMNIGGAEKFSSESAARTAGYTEGDLFYDTSKGAISMVLSAVTPSVIFSDTLTNGNQRTFSYADEPNSTQLWQVQSPNETWNVKESTNIPNYNTFRFEVRPGDNWAGDEPTTTNPSGNDQNGGQIKERAEVYQKNSSHAGGIDIWISQQFKVDPKYQDPVLYTNSNGDYYCFTGQWHNSDVDDAGPVPFAFNYKGMASLQLQTKGFYNQTRVDRATATLNPRGEWNHLVIRVRFNTSRTAPYNGQFQWWMNGQPMDNVSNMDIGTTVLKSDNTKEQTNKGYWKSGIYRTPGSPNNPDGTKSATNPRINFAMEYANMEVNKTTSLLKRVTAPLPVY